MRPTGPRVWPERRRTQGGTLYVESHRSQTCKQLRWTINIYPTRVESI